MIKLVICRDEFRLKQISDLLSSGIEDVAPDYARELKMERDAILARVNTIDDEIF